MILFILRNTKEIIKILNNLLIFIVNINHVMTNKNSTNQLTYNQISTII